MSSLLKKRVHSPSVDDEDTSSTKEEGGQTPNSAKHDSDLDDNAIPYSDRLKEACDATNAARPLKRHKTEVEKREERLSANRRSARESRNRKKMVLEELQRSVTRLAEENAALRKENRNAKAGMSELRRQLGVGDDGAPTPGVAVGNIGSMGGMGSVAVGQQQQSGRDGTTAGSGVKSPGAVPGSVGANGRPQPQQQGVGDAQRVVPGAALSADLIEQIGNVPGGGDAFGGFGGQVRCRRILP